MAKFVFIVFGLTFFVDLLLILGTNRLAGYPSGIKRAVPAGLLGGCYATLCLVPSFSFLGKGAWQIVTLGLFVLVAFGLNHSTLRRTVTWLLLKFALHGAAASFENGGFGAVMTASVGIALLLIWGMPEMGTGRELIPVVLNYGDRQWQLTALHDTVLSHNYLALLLLGQLFLIIPLVCNQLILDSYFLCFLLSYLLLLYLF